VLNELIHSRQWFNTLIQRSRTAGSVAYTVFVWPFEAVRVRPWNIRVKYYFMMMRYIVDHHHHVSVNVNVRFI